MDQAEKDAGVLAALMIRFTESRLPRAERLLDKVNGGAKLSEGDIQFLKRVYEEGKLTRSLFKRHPEYRNLVLSFTALYIKIITKGLENEQLS